MDMNVRIRAVLLMSVLVTWRQLLVTAVQPKYVGAK
jgi:hypothetical protein